MSKSDHDSNRLSRQAYSESGNEMKNLSDQNFKLENDLALQTEMVNFYK